MILREISLFCWRNFKEQVFYPSEGVNILFGDNGQGKTNLLEAIWMFTGTKSFRGAREAHLVMAGEPTARLFGKFQSDKREQEAVLFFGERKNILLNHIEQKSARELIGIFPAVSFSPVHLSLIKGAAAERRKAFTTLLCQVSRKNTALVLEYNKALMERNALLRDASKHSQLLDLIEVFDKTLSLRAPALIRAYFTLCTQWFPKIQNQYDLLCGSAETLSLQYESGLPGFDPVMSEKEISELFEQQLKKTRQQDLRLGFTTIGPQRDDINFLLNGVSLRHFGSQGQQRTAVMAMKLAECEVLSESCGETPILLLDDVLSELDEKRRNALLSPVMNWQIFVTCCDRDPFEGRTAGSLFTIQNGKIISAE